MVWQAYIDESIDDGVFVLAGYLAPAEKWAKFAAEWEQMLPWATLGNDGRYRFKMSEMASLPERMKRVPGFYRIIENNVTFAFSFAMRLADFEEGKRRILSVDTATGTVRRIGGEVLDNPYLFAFSRLMVGFHLNRVESDFLEFIPTTDKVDFIFDDRMEKKAVFAAWEQFIENTGWRERFGATPRFEDDTDFVPLQAADFMAWWARKWGMRGAPIFPWDTHREMKWIRTWLTADGVFSTIQEMVQRQWGSERKVYDRKRLTETVIPLPRLP